MMMHTNELLTLLLSTLLCTILFCASLPLFADSAHVVVSVNSPGEANETAVQHIVRYLAKEGEICKVFDHNWRSGRLGEGEGVIFTDHRPNTLFRTCRICGVCQSQNTDDWE